ncbi:MAG: lipoate--protein ligase family protein [Sulfuricurvum sp.]|nr:lipoate--protein ligase family protein [Sulfuricurvum sp.]MDP3023590.1 lipoate--protein ligase family protein [Sulfuricurvum sp.]
MIITNTWRLIDSGSETAQSNMAIDEALLNCYKEGDMPIMRLYGWEDSLSFGRFSTLSKSLNTHKVQSENIPCVRRMSGGGILLHGGDLSYTLIIPRDWLKGTGVKESYHYLCGFLISLYKKMGYQAHFARDLKLDEIPSEICLAGLEAYDIVIKGKKIGGNAQRYTRHTLFQHGSIPMRINEVFFNELFSGDAGLDKMATLQQLGTPILYEDLSLLVQEAFCETFEVKLVPDTLSESEQRHAKQLQAEKYSQERWNLHG